MGHIFELWLVVSIVCNISHCEYESDLRSNEHYLSSSEKKACLVSQRSWVQIPYRPEFFFRPSFNYYLNK